MTKKLLLPLVAWALLTTYSPSPAFAQTDDGIDSDLVEAELLTSEDEAPPAAEYPYPGAKEEGVVKAPRVSAAERPMKIDEETDTYYYDTRKAPEAQPSASNEQGLKSISDSGTYEYKDDETIPKFSERAGVEKPASIKADGTFNYTTEESGRSGLFSVRLGIFNAPKIENDTTNPIKVFQDIYSQDQFPVLFADYEKGFTTPVGRIGLKFSSGLFVAQGKGSFERADPGRRQDDIPEEQYTFLMLPNQLTGVYRFQYADTQPIVPYIEGGAGYFTFTELRDDNKGPKFGGAATLIAAGGLNFLLDWVDKQAIRRLDNEYGINHVWLTTEYRQVVGLNKSYDFTSSVLNVGFLMEF